MRANDRSRWSGDRLGRWSLRLDAAYCTVLGAGMAIAAPLIATVFPLPAWALVVTGVAVLLWALLIVILLVRVPLRTALRLVMVANLLAAAVVAAISALGATLLVLAAILAVATDIALFAVSQAFALRRMRGLSSPTPC